jgi:NAD(P)-dependent dehydrogenase (short-subunit alcohol dehydrogenase family)
LLKHNAAKIITLSSNKENASKMMERLKPWGDTSRILWQQCNLKDLGQVDQLAQKVKEEEKRIDAVRRDTFRLRPLADHGDVSLSSMLELVSTSSNSQRMVWTAISRSTCYPSFTLH